MFIFSFQISEKKKIFIHVMCIHNLILVLLAVNHSSYFSVKGPMLWNSLPNNIRETKSLSTFKKNMKTFPFKRSFYEAF